MGETIQLQFKIIKICTAILLSLSAIALVFFDDPLVWVYGYIFGGLIGILNFMLLAKTIEKAMKMPPARAQIYVSSNYFIRFSIMIIVLIVSLKADYINTLATVIGLLLIKLVILVTNILGDREYYKRIFRRKEEK
ncbi:MAG: ATP synthase subunit I [Eubacteriales bacterium]|nr:ATP synthase subunit I [Eubacteriales bacterium]